MFSEHKEWTVTVANGYSKIVANGYDEARQIAFDKFGQSKCKFFYPLNTTEWEKQQWKNITGYELQTAENVIEKYNLREIV